VVEFVPIEGFKGSSGVVQVAKIGVTYSGRAFEPGCPTCGAMTAWTDANGTQHFRCRAIVSEGQMVAPCVEGAHHVG
jgi:hypothetical protein